MPAAADNRLVEPVAVQVARHRSDWAPWLHRWASSAAGQATLEAVDARRAAGATVYPADVFRALVTTPLAEARVVILGQDPYHGPGQAEGLAFSVPAGQRLPPSLRNIFKELQRDLGVAPPTSGSLLPWARRGVLLLNTTLTVEDAQPASHAKLGWQVLTDLMVSVAATDGLPKVFMLWGHHAAARAPLVPHGRGHLVLQCNHPSPLSATRGPVPFIGCSHFSRARDHLSATSPGATRFDWRLDATDATQHA